MSTVLKERSSAMGQYESVDSEQMLDRARSLVPILAQREAAAIKAREIPAATMDDFRRSNLLRLLQPRRFGGLQSTVALFSRVAEELANGCASSAWVYTVFGEHAWIIASMPEQGQVDVWGNNPHAVASSSLAPRAVAKAETGGFRLSGQFPFSSGCGHAQWAIVGAFSDEPGRDHRYMLVPIADLEVLDDWDVIGLRATGSKTLVLNNVFVPEHRTVLLADLIRGTPPGRLVHPDYELLSSPRFNLCVYSQMSVAITLGRRALEHVTSFLRDRTSGAGKKPAHSDVIQLKFAQSAAEIDGATLIFRTARQAATEATLSGQPISPEDIAARHRDVAFSQQLIRVAVERLCDISGTSWVYNASPLQGMLRDILTLSTHGVVNLHLAMLPYARTRLSATVPSNA